MKRVILLSFLLYAATQIQAQKINVDSLKKVARYAKADTDRLFADLKLTSYYTEYKVDSAFVYNNEAIPLAQKIGNKDYIDRTYWQKAYAWFHKGNYSLALKFTLRILPDLEQNADKSNLANLYNLIGIIYKAQQNYPKALFYFRQCRALAEKAGDKEDESYAFMNTADLYGSLHLPDSSIYYAKAFFDISRLIQSHAYFDFAYHIMGDDYLAKKNFPNALKNLQLSRSLALSDTFHDPAIGSDASLSLVKYYTLFSQPDSMLYYARSALMLADTSGYQLNIYNSSKALSGIYESRHQLDSAFKYLKISIIAEDSLYSAQKSQEFANTTTEESERQDARKFAETEYKNRFKMYGLAGVLFILAIIGFFLWRNSKNQKKAYLLVSKQKVEIEKQRNNAEQTLATLKQTQTQLIQSEKMASLGELTAGIAHEIQNPLNFVNNFSEVNTELVDELLVELQRGDLEEAKNIALDLQENEKKVNMHGKRADFIVKGMLQHSRTSTGEKQLTDINILADEFFKLSYHGLRAKDKNFNAELITDFDKNPPKVNIVQQDIGRVLLNLFNNAFYAVNQKQKTAGADYKPEVSVSTSKEKDSLIIKVKDNGSGIPDSIKEKIMQPFFTTKPTGEGTGLGLSLSYDIVVKGHNGTMQVNNQADGGAEFVVILPL